MDTTKLQREIDRAFRCVSRPTSFTTCRCEECSAIDALLHDRDHSTLTEDHIGMSLCLLSPAGLTYWTPALVRLCLTHPRARECDVCDQFVKSHLGLPLSRDTFPTQHPKFDSLNLEQTSLLLKFLTHIEEQWYTNASGETPRELDRAIRNWKRLAGVNE